MSFPLEPSPLVSAARRRASVLPWLIGVFLLITAWLKILAPAEAARVQSAHDIPYWLLVAGIQLERAVVLLLVARVWTPWAWATAIALFASFAGISLTIGTPLPPVPYLDPKVSLSAGRWIVVLNYHDCPKCQSAPPEYDRIESESRPTGTEGILAVKVPPFGLKRSIDGATLKQARLSEAREWFVQATVEIELEAGVVTGASFDLPSIVLTADEPTSSEDSV